MPIRHAVFGQPIAHSLSPRIHAAFGAQLGIAVDYRAIEAGRGDFAAALAAFARDGGAGANVTLPLKEDAAALCASLSERARRCGSVNTLIRDGGGWRGDSTDGVGLLRDLRERHGFDPAGRRILLLGAGGAARAAAFALLDAGARTLTITNRTPERAYALATARSDQERTSAVEWGALDRCAAFDLIVNATSAGVQHAALVLPRSLVQTRTFAYDLSYGPAAQSFLDWAQAAGCAAAFDGLGMLVETAAASFERWHGVQPNAGAALQVLRDLVHPPAASPRPPSFRRG